MTGQTAPCMLLMGGSFNPPHIGHLRVAIEGSEALRPEKTLFIPVASPPHKPDDHMLPFEMRVDMLRRSIDLLPAEWKFGVCEIENDRRGPSFTIDTLEILHSRHPETRLVFIMGAEDYAWLSTWRRWREIPLHADLAVIPRKEHGEESFHHSTLALWPDARRLPIQDAAGSAHTAHGKQAEQFCHYARPAYSLPGGGHCLYLPIALLEISSSMIREHFLTERSLDFLVPSAVQEILFRDRRNIHNLWS